MDGVLKGQNLDFLIFECSPMKVKSLDAMRHLVVNLCIIINCFLLVSIELLRHVPDCRLPFNKFIPAYHHHFGRQCRYTLQFFLPVLRGYGRPYSMSMIVWFQKRGSPRVCFMTLLHDVFQIFIAFITNKTLL